jgi:hypothetical protein
MIEVIRSHARFGGDAFAFWTASKPRKGRLSQ